MKLFGPHRSIVSGMVLAALLATTSACYGPFNLTRSVYKWNGNVKGSGEVNEKWNTASTEGDARLGETTEDGGLSIADEHDVGQTGQNATRFRDAQDDSDQSD